MLLVVEMAKMTKINPPKNKKTKGKYKMQYNKNDVKQNNNSR